MKFNHTNQLAKVSYCSAQEGSKPEHLSICGQKQHLYSRTEWPPQVVGPVQNQWTAFHVQASAKFQPQVELADAWLQVITLVRPGGALQTGPTENPWYSAITSHFGYWGSMDTALFVLRALHGLDVRQGSPKTEAAGALSPVASPPKSPAAASAR